MNEAQEILFATIKNICNRAMTPLIMAVKARQPESVASWSTHEGEEFIYVLTGSIELHTEFYKPVTLEAGDSAYIDSGMPHMFVSIGHEDATIASICYSEAIEGPSFVPSAATTEAVES